MSTFRVSVLVAIVSLFSVGCGVSQAGGSGPNDATITGQTAIPSGPTATLEATAETSSVDPAAPTVDPTAESAAGAAPTLPPMGQEMLSVFPMSLGASWTYNLVLDYDSQTGLQHFEGEITETVIEATPHIEAWVFRTEISGHPMYPDHPSNNLFYTMIGGGLYRFMDQESAVAATNPQETANYAANQILAWPLELGQMMGDPALMNAEGRNVWKVESDNVVIDLPAGHFEGCYIVSMLTNPDDLHRWFCPGTGFVMYEGHHHGAVHDEIWTLIAFTAGS